MTELQAEDDHTRIFPMMMTYIVFSIDPVGTVAPLEDPEASLAAEKITTKRYVGYVRDFDAWPDDTQSFQSFYVQVLRQGLPAGSEETFIKSDMCVAVLPNDDSPYSREPLRPERPLPWPNCYHSSFDDVLIRVPTKYADVREALSLPIRQGGLHTVIRNRDHFRRDDMRRTYEATHPRSETAISASLAAPQQANADISTEVPPKVEEDSRPGSSIADGTEAYYDPDDAMAELDAARTSDALPLAIVSYDLSTIQEPLPDPSDLYDEIQLIEKLQKESNARAPERIAGAIELARQRDEDAYGNLPKAVRKDMEPEQTHEQVTAAVTEPGHERPTASVSQNERQRSLWIKLKGSIVTINHYFGEHPFWGEPVDPPPAIVVMFQRLGVRINNIARHCACGTFGLVS